MSDTNAELLWIDLEMTGLDPSKDKILEVAAIATDWNFNELANFESGFGHETTEIAALLDANPFYVKMKANKAPLLKLVESSPPPEAVEAHLTNFIKQHFNTAYPVVLAGNSVHMDRLFIRQYMPFVEQLLHYRMLDVTAWKIVFEGKYGTEFKKQEKHRALEDIRESIDELKFYLERIKGESQGN